MKNKFNFLQIANWLYVCINNFVNIQNSINTNEEKIALLKIEKRKIEILQQVLNRQIILSGINKDFLKGLSEIKKKYKIND